jgi:hypothetical protein
VIACVAALLPALVSYVSAMAQPSNSSLSVRSVEWLRDNGLRGLVNTVESIYYTWQAPSEGGPTIKRLPAQAGQVLVQAARKARAQQAAAAAAAAYRPPSITPLIHPTLAGEGLWREPFAAAAGQAPPVLVTSFRSDPNYPQTVAGIAWINHLATTTWLYPGALEPAVTMASRGPEEIPSSMRPRLVATFNSGFKLADSGGGFVYRGHTYAPMTHGTATIVRYRDGSLDVIAWPYGSQAPANVYFARQNLPLIVNGGVPNPNLSGGPEWGATLGNAVQVWRSAVGIDAKGNLIYGAADYQTVGSLAKLMIHAGAVRAMELDINVYWPSFITYTHPGAAGASNLLPGMIRSTQRYLTPDDRDFFGVFLR